MPFIPALRAGYILPLGRTFFCIFSLFGFDTTLSMLGFGVTSPSTNILLSMAYGLPPIVLDVMLK